MKNVAQVFSGLLVLGGVLYGTWSFLPAVWAVVSSLDKSVVAALVTGILIATGAICTKHIEHKHAVEAQFRDAKVELFDEFMERLNEASRGGTAAAELMPAMEMWKRRTLFRGGPKVVRGFLSLNGLESDSRTVEGLARSVEMLGKLILAMRKDVGLSNRGLAIGATNGVSKGTIVGARYMLRHADLFLKCLRENPSMPLEALTDLEKTESEKNGLSS